MQWLMGLCIFLIMVEVAMLSVLRADFEVVTGEHFTCALYNYQIKCGVGTISFSFYLICIPLFRSMNWMNLTHLLRVGIIMVNWELKVQAIFMRHRPRLLIWETVSTWLN